MPSPAATPNKWVIALTVVFGTFLAVMDVSVVNVVLPHMMGNLGQTQSAITWVATSYSIAQIIMLTMAGWWSTLLGRKRLYLGSMALFTVGSILCGTAQTFPQMIAYRIIQGVGGGVLIPVSQAILRETFPHEEQGTAMAVYGMGVVLAPAIGPVLGGWLTDTYGWPWIFYINVPVALLGMVCVGIFLEDPPYLRRGIGRIDWTGIALLGISMTGLQVVLERGQEENWFDSAWLTAAAVVTLITFVALIVWELRTPEPIINLRLLRNVPLTVASSVGFVFGIGLFGSTFVLPQFTQRLLGYPALEAGLVLLPRAMALFVMMPVAGWLYRYVSPKLLVLAGLFLIYLSFDGLGRLSLQADFWTLVPVLMLMGAGMPFMFVTTSTVALSSLPPADMTDASSLFTLTRLIGGNVGYAIVATFVARRVQFHHARLAEHVSYFNPLANDFLSGAVANFISQGLDPAAAQRAALALLDRTVNRHAAMLAYNDISWLFGLMFLAIIPLVFLLPSRRKLFASGQATAH